MGLVTKIEELDQKIDSTVSIVDRHAQALRKAIRQNAGSKVIDDIQAKIDIESERVSKLEVERNVLYGKQAASAHEIRLQTSLTRVRELTNRVSLQRANAKSLAKSAASGTPQKLPTISKNQGKRDWADAILQRKADQAVDLANKLGRTSPTYFVGKDVVQDTSTTVLDSPRVPSQVKALNPSMISQGYATTVRSYEKLANRMASASRREQNLRRSYNEVRLAVKPEFDKILEDEVRFTKKTAETYALLNLRRPTFREDIQEVPIEYPNVGTYQVANSYSAGGRLRPVIRDQALNGRKTVLARAQSIEKMLSSLHATGEEGIIKKLRTAKAPRDDFREMYARASIDAARDLQAQEWSNTSWMRPDIYLKGMKGTANGKFTGYPFSLRPGGPSEGFADVFQPNAIDEREYENTGAGKYVTDEIEGATKSSLSARKRANTVESPVLNTKAAFWDHLKMFTDKLSDVFPNSSIGSVVQGLAIDDKTKPMIEYLVNQYTGTDTLNRISEEERSKYYKMVDKERSPELAKQFMEKMAAHQKVKPPDTTTSDREEPAYIEWQRGLSSLEGSKYKEYYTKEKEWTYPTAERDYNEKMEGDELEMARKAFPMDFFGKKQNPNDKTIWNARYARGIGQESHPVRSINNLRRWLARRALEGRGYTRTHDEEGDVIPNAALAMRNVQEDLDKLMSRAIMRDTGKEGLWQKVVGHSPDPTEMDEEGAPLDMIANLIIEQQGKQLYGEKNYERMKFLNSAKHQHAIELMTGAKKKLDAGGHAADFGKDTNLIPEATTPDWSRIAQYMPEIPRFQTPYAVGERIRSTADPSSETVQTELPTSPPRVTPPPAPAVRSDTSYFEKSNSQIRMDEITKFIQHEMKELTIMVSDPKSFFGDFYEKVDLIKQHIKGVSVQNHVTGRKLYDELMGLQSDYQVLQTPLRQKAKDKYILPDVEERYTSQKVAEKLWDMRREGETKLSEAMTALRDQMEQKAAKIMEESGVMSDYKVGELNKEYTDKARALYNTIPTSEEKTTMPTVKESGLTTERSKEDQAREYIKAVGAFSWRTDNRTQDPTDLLARQREIRNKEAADQDAYQLAHPPKRIVASPDRQEKLRNYALQHPEPAQVENEKDKWMRILEGTSLKQNRLGDIASKMVDKYAKVAPKISIPEVLGVGGGIVGGTIAAGAGMYDVLPAVAGGFGFTGGKIGGKIHDKIMEKHKKQHTTTGYDWDETVTGFNSKKTIDAFGGLTKFFTDIPFPDMYQDFKKSNVKGAYFQTFVDDIIKNKQKIFSSRGTMPGDQGSWFKDELLKVVESVGINPAQVTTSENTKEKAKQVYDQYTELLKVDKDAIYQYVDGIERNRNSLQTALDELWLKDVGTGRKRINVISDTERAAQLKAANKREGVTLPPPNPHFETEEGKPVYRNQARLNELKGLKAAMPTKGDLEQVWGFSKEYGEIPGSRRTGTENEIPKEILAETLASIKAFVDETGVSQITMMHSHPEENAIISPDDAETFKRVFQNTQGIVDKFGIVGRKQTTYFTFAQDLKDQSSKLQGFVDDITTQLAPAIRSTITDEVASSMQSNIAKMYGISVTSHKTGPVSSNVSGLIDADMGDLAHQANEPAALIDKYYKLKDAMAVLKGQAENTFDQAPIRNEMNTIYEEMTRIKALVPVLQEGLGTELTVTEPGEVVHTVPETTHALPAQAESPYQVPEKKGRKWMTPEEMIQKSFDFDKLRTFVGERTGLKPSALKNDQFVSEIYAKLMARLLPMGKSISTELWRSTSGTLRSNTDPYEMEEYMKHLKNNYEKMFGRPIPYPEAAKPAAGVTGGWEDTFSDRAWGTLDKMIGRTVEINVGTYTSDAMMEASKQLRAGPGFTSLATTETERGGGLEGAGIAHGLKATYTARNQDQLDQLINLKRDIEASGPEINQDRTSIVLKDKEVTLSTLLNEKADKLRKTQHMMVQSQMAMLGVYFSTLSVMNLIGQVWGALGSQLQKIETIFSNIGLAIAFGPKGGAMAGMIRSMLGDTKNIVNAWKQYQGLTASISTMLAYVAYKIFSDKRVVTAITDMLDKLATMLMDPGFIEKIIVLVSKLIEAIPTIVSFLMWVATKIMEIATLPGMDKILAFMIGLGVAAAMVMPFLAMFGAGIEGIVLILKGLAWALGTNLPAAFTALKTTLGGINISKSLGLGAGGLGVTNALKGLLTGNTGIAAGMGANKGVNGILGWLASKGLINLGTKAVAGEEVVAAGAEWYGAVAATEGGIGSTVTASATLAGSTFGAAFIAAIVLVLDAWIYDVGGFRTYINKALDDAMGGITEMGNKLGSIIKGIFGSVLYTNEMFAKMWDAMLTWDKEKVKKLGSELATGISKAVTDGLLGAEDTSGKRTGGLLDIIVAGLVGSVNSESVQKQLGRLAVDILLGVGTAVWAAGTVFADIIIGIIDGIATAFRSGDWSKLDALGADIGMTIAQGILRMIPGYDFLAGMYEQTIGRGQGAANERSALPGQWYWDPISKQNVLKKAAGGSVYPGQSYMVGERGPEMFTTKQSGTIVPNDQLGGGVNTQTVTNYLTVTVNNKTDEKYLMELINKRYYGASG